MTRISCGKADDDCVKGDWTGARRLIVRALKIHKNVPRRVFYSPMETRAPSYPK